MYQSREDLIKALEKEDKVHFTIPRIGNEECNITIQIDGFAFVYPTGEDIEVPKSIGELLAKRYNVKPLEKPKTIVL